MNAFKYGRGAAFLQKFKMIQIRSDEKNPKESELK